MQKRYLDEAQQRRLLEGPKRSTDPLAQRDYHWLAALMLTGMRITEFSRLSVSLVRRALDAGWLVSPKEHCKGKRKANDYKITLPLRQHLQALLKLSDAHPQAGEPDQPLVWGRDISGRAGPLSVRSYEDRIKHWAQVAGLDPRISPHWLRHTRAMNVMRRGRGKEENRLKVAQIALNHASLKSTGVYLGLSREEYEAEIQAIDGGRMRKREARRAVEEMTS
ncbi:phage integrase family protein [Pseudacidovorax intermedius]|uniref:Phage integrase family protein n=1 Tax=Pseudacidovorax intermedius TaxID=433924 RepID=A0A370FFJ8_9BURK|nr:tyrosine-type recombinase/integrase [Pseudacidovorax intermedius]RDI25192.1 phage integrase family protein [Pseudacidovorax intermedius]